MFGRRKEENVPESLTPLADKGPEARTTPTQMRSEPAPIVHKRLGELLLDEKLVSQTQLDEAMQAQKLQGGFIGQILVKMGYVTQSAVASCLVKQCKIPHLSLLDYDIGLEVLSLVPQAICLKYNLIPIDKLGRILTVAMVDPLDLDALEAVRQVCPDLRIKPILCNWEHFDLVASRVFARAQLQRDGGPAYTTESLGLSDKAPARRHESPVPPLAEVLPPVPEPLPLPDPLPVQETSPFSAPQMAQAAREAVQEVVRAATEQRTADTAFSAEELAAVIRDSMHEAAGSIVSEMRRVSDIPAVQARESLEPQVLAQLIRDNVGGAMQEALAQVMVLTRANAASDKAAAAPNLEEFASVVSQSVGGAVQEAMASMVVQLRAMIGPKEMDGALPRGLAELLRETQAAAGATVAKAVTEMTQSLASHESRLTELAEAAVNSARQTVQLVEKDAVSENVRRDLGGARPERHASVAPFGRVHPGQTEGDVEVYKALESEHPLETLTFDNFFPGSANAFTFRLSQAVAAQPGREYNPFFLFGSVGIGKTHLISAIGNTILRNNGTRVGYVSASHFAHRLAEAMQDNALDAFRENYCHWDVLILDDIQFMGGRVEAQEEFFHIFNVLHQQGRQIIIASDKAPDRLGLLEQRLVSRFASGIVAELKAPEWETRMEILRHYVARSGAKVPEEILSLIAMRVSNDVRKMTGSLKKIVAFANLVGQDMSCEMADEILSHLNAA